MGIASTNLCVGVSGKEHIRGNSLNRSFCKLEFANCLTFFLMLSVWMIWKAHSINHHPHVDLCWTDHDEGSPDMSTLVDDLSEIFSFFNKFHLWRVLIAVGILNLHVLNMHRTGAIHHFNRLHAIICDTSKHVIFNYFCLKKIPCWKMSKQYLEYDI